MKTTGLNPRLKSFSKLIIFTIVMTLLLSTVCYASTYRTLYMSGSGYTVTSSTFTSTNSISIHYNSSASGTFELQEYISGRWITWRTTPVSSLATIIYNENWTGNFRIVFTNPSYSSINATIGYFN